MIINIRAAPSFYTTFTSFSFGRFQWLFMWLWLALWVIVTHAVDNVPADPPTTTTTSSNIHHHHHPLTTATTTGAAHNHHAAQHAIRTTLEDLQKHSTLAGSFQPLLHKLWLTEQEVLVLWKSICATTHWEDVVVMVLLGWGMVPLLEGLHHQQWSPWRLRQNNGSSSKTAAATATSSLKNSQQQTETTDHRTSRRRVQFVVAHHAQHIAQIALLVYVVDILKMICMSLGWSWGGETFLRHRPHAFAQCAYTLYLTRRIQTWKTHSVRTYVSRHPETFGRANVFRRLTDVVLYALTMILLLSFLHVPMGPAMHSLLAMGSVGTLTVGLASQSIVAQILHGLLLASSSRIYEGDTIRLQSGQTGTIVHLGWLETTLRGSDEVMVSIPNVDLLKQHVSNLSRVRYCQIHQTLHVRHQDAAKIQDLVHAIKNEICASCPEVITDGSRPFRTYWTGIGDSSLQVTVDAHFRIRPTTEQFWENRQRVLFAIHRACQLTGVELYVPAAAVIHPQPEQSSFPAIRSEH